MVKNIFAAIGAASLAVFALNLIVAATSNVKLDIDLVMSSVLILFFGTIIIVKMIDEG